MARSRYFPVVSVIIMQNSLLSLQSLKAPPLMLYSAQKGSDSVNVIGKIVEIGYFSAYFLAASVA